MYKLMILGASILQLPAITKAKEMGCFVIAVDMDKNAIGFKDADISLVISTIDIPNVIKAAKKYDIDGIMTLASDMPMRTVAAVAHELSLVGIDDQTALRATNKAFMRECLHQNNVPIPKFQIVREYDEYISVVGSFGKRFIVKPANNSGSRGVFLVENPQDLVCLQKAFEYSKNESRGGELLVEEYMEGKEVSVESISINDEVHIIAITDKMTTGSPKFIELGHSQPSMLSDDVKEKIKEVATAAIRAIGINNGPAHTEIIVTEDGPKIVELGARLGGDNITTHLVPLSTGINMVECCIRLALGLEIDMEKKWEKGAAIRYFNTENGKIKSIDGVEAANRIPGVKQVSFTKSIGDTLGTLNSSSDRIGFVIAQSDKVQDAIITCESALDCITICLE